MKKTTKNKKNLLKTILLALAYKAQAYIWLVIAILVIIVGAVIIYNLVKIINRVLPEKKANVTRVWLDSTNFSGWVYDNAPTNYFTSMGGEDSLVPETTFNIQYGIRPIDTNMIPIGWLACGTQIEAVQFSESVGTNLDNYSFIMTGLGQVFRITCTDGLYSSELLIENTNTYRVVIERSTDLNVGIWDPIFTNNTCGVWYVDNYVDTNAPSKQGFYRLNISTNPN